MKATWTLIALLLANVDCYGAAAQETGKSFRIGYLGSGSPTTSGRYVAGFRDALKGLGYVEGQNTLITYRWAAGKVRWASRAC
jgi:aspartate aminotransferase-like enzyme